MTRLIVCLVTFVAGMTLLAPVGLSQDKDDPKEKTEKPALGDKEELALQNKRTLKVRNETASTLTVYLQFRSQKMDAWTWLPTDPASSTEAISFNVDAGMETDVKYDGEPLAASRMRIWATSATHKWLRYKSKDVWLVPEKNDDGEHVYTAESVESFTFAFARTKSKDETPFDETVGERTYPTEGEEIPPPEEVPWDDVPPGFPIVRDLSVLPVQVMGANILIRVRNLGHINANVDRHVMLQRLVPPGLPVEIGHVGPLYHYGVKSFYLVGLKPGSYRVFLSPGDDFPYDGNDRRMFAITKVSYADAAVLPVVVMGSKVHLKVKNVGTDVLSPGQHLMVRKLPMGMPLDRGPIGFLGVNGVKVYPPFDLPPGTYRAYVSPGDASPYELNDAKIFSVAAATHVDLDVLPVIVSGGQVTISVKNIGTADAPAMHHLFVKKLPMGMPIDHGGVGPLAAGKVKVFPKFSLPAGDYRAYLDPGDKAPYHVNDFENFKVVMPPPPAPDLEATFLAAMGAKVKGTIKNNGPGKYSGGRQWHIEKKVGTKWMPVPGGSGAIGAINAGAMVVIEATFTGPAMYRLRITPGDGVPVNDVKTKVLP